MKRSAILLTATLLVSVASYAQHFAVTNTGIFRPQNKKVLLLKEPDANKSMVLFKTNLHVNTDGTPLSYHPQDLAGTEKALNNICNAVAIRKTGSAKNLCLSRNTYAEAISVFRRFRDAQFLQVPDGYTITWENVLIPEVQNGKKVPCIIKTGPYAGYFGSATSLKNGLTNNKGECECNNQVNPLKIPALVLVGGNNIVKQYGARLGDLVIAYNPRNKNLVYAIVNDFGPPHNLGEGSVLLNMQLLGDNNPPKNKRDTYRLSIGSDIIIAIIPNSRTYQEAKPYTQESVNNRVTQWLNEAGFTTKNALIDFLERNKPKLN